MLHLTGHGKEVPGEATRLGAEWENTICSGLSAADRDHLLDLLRRVAVSIGVAEGELPDHGTGQRPDPVPPGVPRGSGRDR